MHHSICFARFHSENFKLEKVNPWASQKLIVNCQGDCWSWWNQAEPATASDLCLIPKVKKLDKWVPLTQWSSARSWRRDVPCYAQAGILRWIVTCHEKLISFNNHKQNENLTLDDKTVCVNQDVTVKNTTYSINCTLHISTSKTRFGQPPVFAASTREHASSYHTAGGPKLQELRSESSFICHCHQTLLSMTPTVIERKVWWQWQRKNSISEKQYKMTEEYFAWRPIFRQERHPYTALAKLHRLHGWLL